VLAVQSDAGEAAQKFTCDGGNWYRPDGMPVFAVDFDMLTDARPLLTTINQTPRGQYLPASAEVWSGATHPAGIRTSCCANLNQPCWSSSSSSINGTVGNPVDVEGFFSSGGTLPCNGSGHLYCLQR